MRKHYELPCYYKELEPTAIDKLNSRINNVSNRVSNITPYEESKTAYIGDTETRFSKVKDGNINAYCITESGVSKVVTMELSQNEIVVKYEPLEEVATVSISIQ